MASNRLVFIISQKDIIESSHNSGLYLKPFILNLKTKKENNIKYTLDSSSPTSKSKTFQKELLITGKEYNDSLSYIKTTIPDSIAKFGWRPPLGNQDKATILKYAAFQNEQQISDVKTLTFLIDSNIYDNTKSTKNKFLNKLNNQILNSVFRTTKYQVPIISISTDKENLFRQSKRTIYSWR